MRQTIKTLAAEIVERWPDLDVRVERSHCDTDRKLAGTRLRRPGQGRWGSRIRVYNKTHLLLDHDNAETYRTTGEVRKWIDLYATGYSRPVRERKMFE